MPNAELDLAATVAANVNSAMTGGCHPGVTCDKTGMHPIVGNRWHLKGHDYDLCEAEYQKLAEEEKLKYELIPPPCAPPLAAGFGMGGCAGMGGMGGGRPTPADHGAVDEGGCHPGVSCDKSGMNPIVGFRYHLRGHNYDLCDAEYQKLPPKEQACFEKIAPPPKPKPFGGGGGGGFGGPAAWGTHGGGWGGRCGGGFGGGRGMHRGDGGPKLAARFVRDVSIFDGTQMAPGERRRPPRRRALPYHHHHLRLHTSASHISPTSSASPPSQARPSPRSGGSRTSARCRGRPAPRSSSSAATA